MEEKEIYITLNKYKKELEQRGYKVIYIGLYGSQNYNCSDEFSDIDVKAIILPTLHDIIFRKVTSKVIEFEKGSIDVKDLITFYEVIKKGNFSYIECINTKYSIGDKYIKKLFSQFKPNLKSILGAMLEKRKALTHEYPSKHEEFKKWGFDPKQYHHIVRLLHLLRKIDSTKEDLSYLTYDNEIEQKNMIAIKRNSLNYTKEQVEKLSNVCIDEARRYIPDDYKYELLNIDKEISDYIEKNIKLELINEQPTLSAREYRTFDNQIPKKDLQKFQILQKYNGQDISYIVYESVEIL